MATVPPPDPLEMNVIDSGGPRTWTSTGEGMRTVGRLSKRSATIGWRGTY